MNIIKIMTVAAIASTTMFSTAFALTNNTQEEAVSENNSISEKSGSIELEVNFSKDRETKIVNPKGIEEEVEVNDVEEDFAGGEIIDDFDVEYQY